MFARLKLALRMRRHRALALGAMSFPIRSESGALLYCDPLLQIPSTDELNREPVRRLRLVSKK